MRLYPNTPHWHDRPASGTGSDSLRRYTADQLRQAVSNESNAYSQRHLERLGVESARLHADDQIEVTFVGGSRRWYSPGDPAYDGYLPLAES